MRLYLVQHGKAKPKEEDPDRSLTETGILETERIATFLKSIRLAVAAIWDSGKTRAAQTAEILASALSPKNGVVHRDNLSPNDPVRPTIERLSSVHEDMMIVGHLPHLGKLASALLIGNEEADVVAFRNSGIVCLERDETGAYRLLLSFGP
jgi:phosphohistidine phosphatase